MRRVTLGLGNNGDHIARDKIKPQNTSDKQEDRLRRKETVNILYKQVCCTVRT